MVNPKHLVTGLVLIAIGVVVGLSLGKEEGSTVSVMNSAQAAGGKVESPTA